MGNGRPPGSDLPAPYESPWRRLAQDLRAVVATLRLRAWELLRRNRQGQLWRPALWPEALASLFWPLLLGGLLLLAVGLGVGVGARGGARVVQSPAAPAVQVGSPSGSGSPEPEAPLEVSPADDATSDAPPVPGPPPLLPDPVGLDPQAVEPAAAAPAAPSLSPLQQALADTAGSELIREARAEPARAQLVLEVRAAFGLLPAPERALRAQAWWQRAQELGYARFELLGPNNGLLARSAVVGGGLVLYDPPPRAAEDPA